MDKKQPVTSALSHDALVLALEKHGLPTWGTDKELQDRYDRNEIGKPYVAPKAEAPKPAIEGNSLLANRVSKEAPETQAEIDDQTKSHIENVDKLDTAVEVTSDNVHESNPEPRETLTAFGPRRGRPPKVG